MDRLWKKNVKGATGKERDWRDEVERELVESHENTIRVPDQCLQRSPSDFVRIIYT